MPGAEEKVVSCKMHTCVLAAMGPVEEVGSEQGYWCQEGYKMRKEGMHWERVVGQPSSLSKQHTGPLQVNMVGCSALLHCE